MEETNNSYRFGIETLIESAGKAQVWRTDEGGLPASVTLSAARGDLAGKRVALLAHPASVDREINHSVERLKGWLETQGAHLTALLGPQHGIRGEKQDNMVESDHFQDPTTGLPVFSLYGESRRLTAEMGERFDLLLVDLQDVGVRVYTFLTTLGYIIEDLQRWSGKELWVLDRPNPTGRAIEGLRLERGWESFVGIDSLPMQHGLTLGEFALWYKGRHGIATPVTVIPMEGWHPSDPREGWPEERIWVQPSPNMPGLYTARAYPGTVMLEGTTLSEARGTTRPLSMVGHPKVDWASLLEAIRKHTEDPETGWSALGGCRVREVTFQPTFHKHAGVPTQGFEIITEGPFYDPERFRPYRLMAALFKMIRRHHPEISLWSEPPYEYEYDRTPIDVITGGRRLREWVEAPERAWSDLERQLRQDENSWREESAPWRLY